MNIVAIVQARMGSVRLPGKVLLDLEGRTVLARVVRRLSRSQQIGEVAVATSTLPADDEIVQECGRLGVACFRGSELDVLDRYYQTARAHGADTVVRITSDCPLIDPGVVDETVMAHQSHKADYASNVFARRYPRGLDTEVFTFSALEHAWREARELYEREHVTPYLYEHPDIFRMASTNGEIDYSRYRWTLDTPPDLELIRAIYSRFDGRDDFSWQEAILLMESDPKLAEINSQVFQKAVR